MTFALAFLCPHEVGSSGGTSFPYPPSNAMRSGRSTAGTSAVSLASPVTVGTLSFPADHVGSLGPPVVMLVGGRNNDSGDPSIAAPVALLAFRPNNDSGNRAMSFVVVSGILAVHLMLPQV